MDCLGVIAFVGYNGSSPELEMALATTGLNMFSANARRFVLMLSLVLVVGGSAAAKPRKMRLATGPWGGLHIRIDVGPGSATIEYDCASGTIDGPLTLDSKGRFTWHGMDHQERPGPTRENDPGSNRPAIYSGSLKGDRMTLTVKLSDTSEVVGTYTLKRGGFGRVFKCK